MSNNSVMLITGSRKGIGRYLAEQYARQGYQVIGCSRSPVEFDLPNYQHHCADISVESDVRKLFSIIRKEYGALSVVLNNAGIASMNHSLLTPMESVQRILNVNVAGSFLVCREAVRLMQKNKFGRIVNFASVASPLQLEGESIYAASKAAVVSLTQILSKEFAPWNVTVNAIGPTPIETDLIKGIAKEKLAALIERQGIKRMGTFADVRNVVDFFIRAESDFITGQTVYLGGVS